MKMLWKWGLKYVAGILIVLGKSISEEVNEPLLPNKNREDVWNISDNTIDSVCPPRYLSMGFILEAVL